MGTKEQFVILIGLIVGCASAREMTLRVREVKI